MSSGPITNPGIMLDPVQAVKVDALATGQRMMRDRIAVDLATFATSHPDPVVADELWAFINHVRKLMPS